ncbi:MAG: BlaB/IND/MUS family subclass metallo-beta-lactamase [Bacteroidota bacterium]
MKNFVFIVISLCCQNILSQISVDSLFKLKLKRNENFVSIIAPQKSVFVNPDSISKSEPYKSADFNKDGKVDELIYLGACNEKGCVYALFLNQYDDYYHLAFMDYLKYPNFETNNNGYIDLISKNEAWNPKKVSVLSQPSDTVTLLLTRYQLDQKANKYAVVGNVTKINNSDLIQSSIEENLGLHISHLVGDYYVFTTYKQLNNQPFPSNGMYCVTADGVILFDTPWDTTQFQPLLDSIQSKHQKKVVMAIATHFHDDRTAGLEYYSTQGIKTYTSKLTYDLCLQNGEKQPTFYFINDTTFTLGKHQFSTYYPGEGHTKDNIVIWCEDAKILYVGCLVKSTENKGLGNLADANLNEWAATIKKVMKKYPKVHFVIPGHFSWSNKKALKHTLKLLKNEKQ